MFNSKNVELILGYLKAGAQGPDGLSSLLLKSARLEISDNIANLFSQCLHHSFVLSQWKNANITPIPKVDHPNRTDYRPISLTSSLCKVLERTLAKYIISLIIDIWRTNNQYGFLPKRSTTDAIVQVIEDWSHASDKNDPIVAIFFDFAKAFDLVDHETLLEKLTKRLPKWLISWIAEYLSDRRQRVVVNGYETNWKEVVAGVIQSFYQLCVLQFA